MMYTASEKLAIIRLVEESELSIRRNRPSTMCAYWKTRAAAGVPTTPWRLGKLSPRASRQPYRKGPGLHPSGIRLSVLPVRTRAYCQGGGSLCAAQTRHVQGLGSGITALILHEPLIYMALGVAYSRTAIGSLFIKGESKEAFWLCIENLYRVRPERSPCR